MSLSKTLPEANSNVVYESRKTFCIVDDMDGLIGGLAGLLKQKKR